MIAKYSIYVHEKCLVVEGPIPLRDGVFEAIVDLAASHGFDIIDAALSKPFGATMVITNKEYSVELRKKCAPNQALSKP